MWTGLEGVPPRTEDMLDFLVVGGGIAGLSCAWALRQAGHQVTVLEQNGELSKNREAIHSIPNMTKILNDWGISDFLSGVVTQIRKINFVDGATGEDLGLTAMEGKILESLPAEFNCIPYGELYRIFYDLGIKAGVEIYLNTRVTKVYPFIPMVTTADGAAMTADVLIGADGINSIVRTVYEEHEPSPGTCLRYALNLVAPADLLRQDKELTGIVDSGSWTGWLADGCSMLGALTGSGPNRGYSITIHLPSLEGGRESWTQFPICDELLNLFEPRAQKILKVAEFSNQIQFVDYEPFDNWVHESGKVLLVGEAAHPTVPSGSYNVSSCFEDALTLSLLYSLPATRLQTALLLGVFEELRQPRCAAVQNYSRRRRDASTLPRGPKQELRDGILRRQLVRNMYDVSNDDYLCLYYSGLCQTYGFDPREVVQDWWVTFGRNILRSLLPEPEEDVLASEPMPIAVEVELEPIGDISDALKGAHIDEEVVSEVEVRPLGKDVSSEP